MPLILTPSLTRTARCCGRAGTTTGQSRFRRDLVVYLVFGGIEAAANLVVGWALYQGFPSLKLPYWVATSFAAACGLLVSFLLNYFCFRFEERSALRQFGTFAIVSGVGVVLTGALSQALLVPSRLLLDHPLLGMSVAPKFAAHFTAVGLVVLYSFPAHRLISFNVGVRARLHQLVRSGVQ